MLLLVLACSTGPSPGGDPVDPDPRAPFSLDGVGPWMVVGLGRDSHVDATPGDEAVMVFGGQGGFHVDVSGRARGVGPFVAVELWVEVAGVTVADNGDPTFLQLRAGPAPEEAWFAGERAFLLDNSLVSVCGWDGGVATVCAAVTSLEDPTLHAADCVDVVLRMDPANLYLCG